jgi:hypothetical protein
MKHLTFIISLFLVINIHADKMNEIWMHDAKLLVKIPSNWVILGHMPIGEASGLSLQPVENKNDKANFKSTIQINTHDLSSPSDLEFYKKGINSKRADDAKETIYEGWSIQTWTDEANQNACAVIINQKSDLCVAIRMTLPLSEDLPKDHILKMLEVLKILMKDINKNN